MVSEDISHPGLVFFLSFTCLSCLFLRCSAALQDVMRLERNQTSQQTSRFQKYKKDVRFRSFRPTRFQQWEWLHWDRNTSRAYDFDFLTGNEHTVMSRIKAQAYFRTSQVCQQGSIQGRIQFETVFYATAVLSLLVAFLLL